MSLIKQIEQELFNDRCTELQTRFTTARILNNLGIQVKGNHAKSNI